MIVIPDDTQPHRYVRLLTSWRSGRRWSSARPVCAWPLLASRTCILAPIAAPRRRPYRRALPGRRIPVVPLRLLAERADRSPGISVRAAGHQADVDHFELRGRELGVVLSLTPGADPQLHGLRLGGRVARLTPVGSAARRAPYGPCDPGGPGGEIAERLLGRRARTSDDAKRMPGAVTCGAERDLRIAVVCHALDGTPAGGAMPAWRRGAWVDGNSRQLRRVTLLHRHSLERG